MKSKTSFDALEENYGDFHFTDMDKVFIVNELKNYDYHITEVSKQGFDIENVIIPGDINFARRMRCVVDKLKVVRTVK